MSDLSNRTLLCYDNGLFTSWAERLGPLREGFGRVLLYVPWKDAFPKSNWFSIGDGLPGVEKVTDFFDVIDEVDCFFFPDVYDGDLQEHLRDLGKPVWGSGKGEELELYRWETKKLLKEIGLPVQPVERIIGLDALREHLKENDDKYIKTSMMRGDFETFHHIRYDLSEPRLDELEHKLGARKQTKEFIVEDSISPALEVGFDGYCIDGEFNDPSILGVEEKDVAYIGVVQPYKQFPEKVRYVNEKLAPILKEYKYRNFFSSEIRLGRDKEPYLTDPCCRAGSPPSEVYQESFSNWADIVWAGAHGEMVKPKPIAKYAVEALIHSSWADQNDEAVRFPEKIDQWVKLRNVARLNGVRYIMPQSVGLPEIGAVVGIDDTLLGAIKKVKSYADQIEGYDLDIKLKDIESVIKVIDDGQQKGIKFTSDPLPTLAQVQKAIA